MIENELVDLDEVFFFGLSMDCGEVLELRSIFIVTTIGSCLGATIGLLLAILLLDSYCSLSKYSGLVFVHNYIIEELNNSCNYLSALYSIPSLLVVFNVVCSK